MEPHLCEYTWDALWFYDPETEEVSRVVPALEEDPVTIPWHEVPAFVMEAVSRFLLLRME